MLISICYYENVKDNKKKKVTVEEKSLFQNSFDEIED